MYLLFVLIQCLLVVFVNGVVDETKFKEVFQGGHSISNGDYYMLEHDIITATVETPEENGYNITWKIIDKQGNLINFSSDRIILPNNVVRFKMWTEILLKKNICRRGKCYYSLILFFNNKKV